MAVPILRSRGLLAFREVGMAGKLFGVARGGGDYTKASRACCIHRMGAAGASGVGEPLLRKGGLLAPHEGGADGEPFGVARGGGDHTMACPSQAKPSQARPGAILARQAQFGAEGAIKK